MLRLSIRNKMNQTNDPFTLFSFECQYDPRSTSTTDQCFEHLSDPVRKRPLQEPVSLAAFTHHWTLHTHKPFNLEEIDKCNTTVTPMSVLDYGLWEKKNYVYHLIRSVKRRNQITKIKRTSKRSL